jgi:uncharacterized phage protein (TIGR02220 family)
MREEIIGYLNEKSGKNFRPNSQHAVATIKARLKEGFTVDDFKRVIDEKCPEWKISAKYCKYLRPETLFGNKFDSYLNEGDPKENWDNEAIKILKENLPN